MRNKLLVLSMAAAIGVVGCNKEEEVTPIIEQPQAQTTAPLLGSNAAPGAQTAPVQAEQVQVNVQPQQPAPLPASPLVQQSPGQVAPGVVVPSPAAQVPPSPVTSEVPGQMPVATDVASGQQGVSSDVPVGQPVMPTPNPIQAPASQPADAQQAQAAASPLVVVEQK